MLSSKPAATKRARLIDFESEFDKIGTRSIASKLQLQDSLPVSVDPHHLSANSLTEKIPPASRHLCHVLIVGTVVQGSTSSRSSKVAAALAQTMIEEKSRVLTQCSTRLRLHYAPSLPLEEQQERPLFDFTVLVLDVSTVQLNATTSPWHFSLTHLDAKMVLDRLVCVPFTSDPVSADMRHYLDAWSRACHIPLYWLFEEKENMVHLAQSLVRLASSVTGIYSISPTGVSTMPMWDSVMHALDYGHVASTTLSS